METSSIVLLVVSCAISFCLGRVFLHLHNKKRAQKAQAIQAAQRQALRDLPAEAISKNRAKRKRQIQQSRKS